MYSNSNNPPPLNRLGSGHIGQEHIVQRRIQGTHRPRDATSKGRIVQETHRQRDGTSEKSIGDTWSLVMAPYIQYYTDFLHLHKMITVCCYSLLFADFHLNFRVKIYILADSFCRDFDLELKIMWWLEVLYVNHGTRILKKTTFAAVIVFGTTSHLISLSANSAIMAFPFPLSLSFFSLWDRQMLCQN